MKRHTQYNIKYRWRKGPDANALCGQPLTNTKKIPSELLQTGFLWFYGALAQVSTPEKVARFNREVAIFIKKWPDIIKNGDPYYNPNLTLRKSNFALRDLLKEKIGEPYDLSVYDKFAPEEKKSDE